MEKGNRGRIAAALFLGVIARGLWAGVAVTTGGSTALYFALGLPAAGMFIGLVILAGWGRSSP
jgi:hypothetical protein